MKNRREGVFIRKLGTNRSIGVICIISDNSYHLDMFYKVHCTNLTVTSSKLVATW